MNFAEFKKHLSEDLLEVFSDSFYVYDSDDPSEIDNVKNRINEMIESIPVVDDNISDEELEEMEVTCIFKNQLDNLEQEDLEIFGEMLWYKLIDWAKKDRFWHDREKGSVYDDNVEGGLCSKF